MIDTCGGGGEKAGVAFFELMIDSGTQSTTRHTCRYPRASSKSQHTKKTSFFPKYGTEIKKKQLC